MSEMVQHVEAVMVGAKEAAALCGVGSTLWTQMVADGRAPLPVKLGRRSLWPVEELRAWARAGCPPRRRWTWPPDNP